MIDNYTICLENYLNIDAANQLQTTNNDYDIINLYIDVIMLNSKLMCFEEVKRSISKLVSLTNSKCTSINDNKSSIAF